MRISISITDQQAAALKRICDEQNISRNTFIHKAINFYITQQVPKVSIREAAGLWKGRPGDGLSIQRAVRGEWND